MVSPLVAGRAEWPLLPTPLLGPRGRRTEGKTQTLPRGPGPEQGRGPEEVWGGLGTSVEEMPLHFGEELEDSPGREEVSLGGSLRTHVQEILDDRHRVPEEAGHPSG